MPSEQLLFVDRMSGTAGERRRAKRLLLRRTLRRYRQIEPRLGTEREEPGDFEQIRELLHTANNLITCLGIARDRREASAEPAFGRFKVESY